MDTKTYDPRAIRELSGLNAYALDSWCDRLAEVGSLDEPAAEWLTDLRDSVVTAVEQDRFETPSDIDGVVHELADASVPIATWEVMQLAADVTDTWSFDADSFLVYSDQSMQTYDPSSLSGMAICALYWAATSVITMLLSWLQESTDELDVYVWNLHHTDQGGVCEHSGDDTEGIDSDLAHCPLGCVNSAPILADDYPQD